MFKSLIKLILVALKEKERVNMANVSLGAFLLYCKHIYCSVKLIPHRLLLPL